MSSSKTTRSSKPKEDAMPSDIKCKTPAALKVFYISESLLNEETTTLKLEKFYHPGHNAPAWFITKEDTKQIMEVMEFAEPRRSWLIDNEVCSNGRLYITTSMDIVFLALYHIRKHCSTKALELETISDEKDPTVARLLTKFVRPTELACIADVKSVGDMTFYKYHPKKAIAWLALKTNRLAASLRKADIHCGQSALSQNYMRSDVTSDELLNDEDFLRMACDIVGGYIELDLHGELKEYLNIKEAEIKSNDEKNLNAKRKSASRLSAEQNKKVKLENENDDKEENLGATEKLKNNSILDESLEADNKDDVKKLSSPIMAKPTPLKERTLTAKEKSLAKGAKGTKSITSFFKK